MKILYTLISFFLVTSIHAQEKYNLSLSANFILDHRQAKIHTEGIVKLENNKATITSGVIKGNFQGLPKTSKNDHAINGNKYWYKPAIIGAKNKLSFHCAHQEFCFLTNPIDVSRINKLAFEIDYSSKGSVDYQNPSDGKIWKDWIEFNYYIDGQIADDNKAERLCGSGHFYEDGNKGTKYRQQNIDVGNGNEFQIEICMKNTGHDEWYTIENIEITETPIIEIDLEVVEVVSTKSKLIKSVISCCGKIEKTCSLNNVKDEMGTEVAPIAEPNIVDSPTLSVFPNPTNHYLELMNSERFDLNSIKMMDAGGRYINITNTYPLNIVSLAAGTYFISVLEKNTQERVSASFVVVRR